MNARTPTKYMHGAATWHAGQPGWIRVDLGGDHRVITRDGSGFIAWIGHQFKAWHFTAALDACVEDMEYQAAEHARKVAHAAYMSARLAKLTPEQIEILRASRAEEIALLDYSDSTDSMARISELRKTTGA